MIRQLLILFIILWGNLVIAKQPTPKACELVKKISKELALGKAVAVSTLSSEDSEGDADHYRNEFFSRNSKKFTNLRVDLKDFKLVFGNLVTSKETTHEVFLKSKFDTFYYPGSILEPQVRDYVKLVYQGTKRENIPDMFHSFAPNKVEFTLPKCDK